MTKLPPGTVVLTTVTIMSAALITIAHARYFGGYQNDGFIGSSAPMTGLYQNWRKFSGVDKRYLFGRLNDRFGGRDGRFVDWSQIIGVPRSKKDFGSDDADGFGIYKGFPLDRQRFAFSSSDFNKKSDDGHASNKEA